MPKRGPLVAPLLLALLLALGGGLLWAMATVFLMETCLEPVVGRAYQSDYEPPPNQPTLVVYEDGQALLDAHENDPESLRERLGAKGTNAPKPTTQRMLDLEGNRVRVSVTKARLSQITLSAAVKSVPAEGVYGTDHPDRVGDGTVPWYALRLDLAGRYGVLAAYDPRTRKCLGYLGPRGFSTRHPRLEEAFRLRHGQDPLELHHVRLETAPPNDGVPPGPPPYGPPGPPPDYYDDYDGYGSGAPGAPGYPPPGAPDGPGKPFEKQVLSDRAYLLASQTLYALDLKAHTIQAVPLPGPVVSWRTTTRRRPAPAGDGALLAQSIGVRLRDRILRYEPERPAPRTFMLPEAVRDLDLRFGETSRGEVVVTATRFTDNASRQELYWLTPAGRILRSHALPWRNLPVYHTPMSTWNRCEFGLAGPALVISAVYALLDRIQSPGERRAPGARPWPWGALDDLGPIPLMTALLGLMCGVLVVLRQRRYDQPWTGAWALFVLVFGLPGYWGYRFGRAWPTVLPCPECGAVVPRDRDACARCGRRFPAPPPKGTELMD